MEILVSNINKQVIEADLRRIFTPFGEVGIVALIRDKLNNRPTGRAFVDMPVEAQANSAILSLNRTMLAGKAISVAKYTEPDF